MFKIIILQLSQCKSTEDLKDLLDSKEFEFRFDAGLSFPSDSVKIEDVNNIIRSLAMHFLVYSCKAELDQLKAGISELGVLSLIHSYPRLFKPLFTASGKPQLTPESVSATFKVCWSPEGSNLRKQEEDVIYGWQEYLQGLKGWSLVTCIYCPVQARVYMCSMNTCFV